MFCCSSDLRDYMSDIYQFYYFMTRCSIVPPTVRSYTKNLSDKDLKKFYVQMKEPLKFLEDDDFMYFSLEHILEYKYDDLSFELYFQYHIDRSYSSNIINQKWIDELEKRYRYEIADREAELGI